MHFQCLNDAKRILNKSRGDVYFHCLFFTAQSVFLKELIENRISTSQIGPKNSLDRKAKRCHKRDLQIKSKPLYRTVFCGTKKFGKEIKRSKNASPDAVFPQQNHIFAVAGMHHDLSAYSPQTLKLH